MGPHPQAGAGWGGIPLGGRGRRPGPESIHPESRYLGIEVRLSRILNFLQCSLDPAKVKRAQAHKSHKYQRSIDQRPDHTAAAAARWWGGGRGWVVWVGVQCSGGGGGSGGGVQRFVGFTVFGCGRRGSCHHGSAASVDLSEWSKLYSKKHMPACEFGYSSLLPNYDFPARRSFTDIMKLSQ